MNLGQYISDLIGLANTLQKVSADSSDPQKIYHMALEIKDSASKVQFWACAEMAKDEKNEKSRRDESWSEAK